MNIEDNNAWRNKPTPMPVPNDVLAYVETIANLFIKPIEGRNDVNVKIQIERVNKTALKERIEKDLFEYFPLSNVTKTFYRRYYWKKLTNYFTYEKYIKDKEIQMLLDELGLDKDKFWYLVLFAYDYSESLCINGIDVAPSAYEQLQTLISNIYPCVTDFDLNNGITIDREIKIEVRITGMKKPIIIDNPTAIYLLVESCERRIEEEQLEDLYIMNYRKPMQESKSLKDSPHIYYFAKMLLNFFDTVESIRNKRKKGANHSLKEMDIVSKLIYFTKLSSNKSWLDIECETLKAYIKQYKNLDLNYKESNIYDNFII